MLFLGIGSQNDRVFLFGSGYRSVEVCAAGRVHTPSAWAWTWKPNLGSCSWCHLASRFGQRELSLPHAWKSLLKRLNSCAGLYGGW